MNTTPKNRSRASVLLHERTALVETLDEHRRELEAITAELKIRGV